MIVLLAASAGVLLGGFRIHSINIDGNSRYKSEKIRDDLIHDFWTQNTLYFAWKYRSKGPADDAPYLQSVQAKMISPTAVRLEVSENILMGRVQYEESNVYYDADGVVQEITDTVYPSMPLVTGIEIEKPVAYQKLTPSNASLLRTMLNISQLLVQAQLIPDNVEFDASGNMTLRFGNVVVSLGQDEYLEEKIANLVQIYPEISSQSGTLNMEGFTGRNEAITFKQDGESEAQSETESESGSSTQSQTLAGVGEDSAPAGDTAAADDGSDGQDTGAQEAPADDGNDGQGAEDSSSSTVFMVFDSSGTLRYDAHVVDGQVVDASGNPIDGCSVNSDGNVVDAYMNVIDPSTGQLAQ